MLEAKVVLPDTEHFSDRYERTPATAEKLSQLICADMHVDRATIEFEIFPDQTEELR